MRFDSPDWRLKGRAVRSLESVASDGEHALVTRDTARAAVETALHTALARLEPDEQWAAILQAVEGYLERHRELGGTLTA